VTGAAGYTLEDFPEKKRLILQALPHLRRLTVRQWLFS
jgi:hypothetical protein